MNRFSDFNVKVHGNFFPGKKVDFADVLNREITVNDFKIEQSKFAGKNATNRRLQLSINMDGVDHVTFTGSEVLMTMISNENVVMPFQTIIKKNNKYFEFT